MNTPALTANDLARTEAAKILHTQLAAINPLDVPIMSRDRCIPRKQQAKLARQLFRGLGLKGISVTAPNYSMAQSVDVAPPTRCDYDLDQFGTMVAGCEAARANTDARQRLSAILLSAFPNHEDRSEPMTDYFDYRWSIG